MYTRYACIYIIYTPYIHLTHLYTHAIHGIGTGKGLPQSNPLWGTLLNEIQIAQAALKAVNGSFDMGTNGWCLGPGDNASYFDQVVRYTKNHV